MGHVSFSQDVFLLRSCAKSEGPRPWARALGLGTQAHGTHGSYHDSYGPMSRWGVMDPMGPWDPWAHGSHRPMGPMRP